MWSASTSGTIRNVLPRRSNTPVSSSMPRERSRVGRSILKNSASQSNRLLSSSRTGWMADIRSRRALHSPGSIRSPSSPTRISRKRIKTVSLNSSSRSSNSGSMALFASNCPPTTVTSGQSHVAAASCSAKPANSGPSAWRPNSMTSSRDSSLTSGRATTS